MANHFLGGLFNWGRQTVSGVSGRLLSPTPLYNQYNEQEKLALILSSPSILKVILLQCDLFSLAKVEIKEGDKVLGNDPLLGLLQNPNPHQSQKQYLWDFMFWNMLGNAVGYTKNADPTDSKNKLYWLHPSKINFPNDFEHKNGDKLILSDASVEQLQKTKIEYRYQDGNKFDMILKDMFFVSDISNGLGNWFKGNSRIDALYKIIANSEAAIDSVNINARFLAKYIVTGKIDEKNINMPMMKEGEKSDIEKRLEGKKKVHAVKTPIDIKRFIDRSAVLKDLSESDLASYYSCGKMFGIPKDVLEANEKGSTFENQEKARGAHVSYTLSPKGEDLCLKLAKRFSYDKKNISLTWGHLPFMQAAQKEEAEVNAINADTFATLVSNGVTPESAAIASGFNDLKYKPNGTGEE